MNGKMRMLIICAVFELISSCKYYASGEDLKQNVKKQIIKGFLDTKEGVVSDDPTVYEIAEKLKEEKQETKEELIQGDDPNNINKAQLLQANR
ncbi:hypothetical protein ER70_07560 (plasmid) [Borreliella bissettiae]|uniref:Uncharacterized protein n=1 Tax=Borrelia bissettiae TaxID=64897 RepID=A0A1L8ZA74_BORBI|nr:hypothetical protein ER70_07560 [Borreliella bissettiae]